jgi:hypothetical protein
MILLDDLAANLQAGPKRSQLQLARGRGVCPLEQGVKNDVVSRLNVVVATTDETGTTAPRRIHVIAQWIFCHIDIDIRR